MSEERRDLRGRSIDVRAEESFNPCFNLQGDETSLSVDVSMAFCCEGIQGKNCVRYLGRRRPCVIHRAVPKHL